MNNNVPSYDFKAMQDADIHSANLEDLIDINDVTINRALPTEERILDFVRQIKNPYLYKCGKVVVKVSFADTEDTLEDKLKGYLLSMQ